jgi:hypothetical protein
LTLDMRAATTAAILASEKVSAVVAERGSAKLLLEVQDVDLGRIEPKALWEDLKSASGRRHRQARDRRRLRCDREAGQRR